MQKRTQTVKVEDFRSNVNIGTEASSHRIGNSYPIIIFITYVVTQKQYKMIVCMLFKAI